MFKRWQKLELYSIQAGWNAEICKKMPTTCRLLKGKLFSETARGRRWTRDWRGQPISNYVTWVVRAPYVLYGVKYIDLVSLGKKGERC